MNTNFYQLPLFFVRKALIFVITGIRPLLGPARCKYPVSCTKFAVAQLNEQPLFKALWNSTKRVISCNPLW